MWEQGQQLYVLHRFAHQAVLALNQVAVPSVRGEVAAAPEWLDHVADQFPGRGRWQR